MTDTRQALQKAFDELRLIERMCLVDPPHATQTLDVGHRIGLVRKDLEAALAAPQPEPQPVKQAPPYCGSSHCSCIECVMEPVKQALTNPVDVLWSSVCPSTPGTYLFKCGESNNHIETVEAFFSHGNLMVRADIGEYGLSDYHNGLTSPMWSLIEGAKP